jgi:hypothetical protein
MEKAMYHGGVNMITGSYSGTLEAPDNSQCNENASQVRVEAGAVEKRKKGLIRMFFDFIGLGSTADYSSGYKPKKSWDGYGSGTFWADTYYRPWY